MNRFESIIFSIIIILSSGLLNSCDKDAENIEKHYDNKYLVAVTDERHISRQEVIELADRAVPGLNLGSSGLSLLIQSFDVVSITYLTTGIGGTQTLASGVVAIPSSINSYNSLLCIQHVTMDIEDAPSVQLFSYELLPAILGRVVVMADYLGYGASRTAAYEHPYLHTELTANACVDMIEAAREFLRKRGISQTDNKLELMGYSQGGSSTLATLLELERRGLGPQVKKVSAGGGAYDLEETFAYYISLGSTPYLNSGFLPFMIRGMEYGEQTYLDATKIYSQRVIDAGYVQNLFPKQRLSVWHRILGSDLTKIVHPDFYARTSYNSNTEIVRLMSMLRKNSIINSAAPHTSVTLYHTPNDEYVPYFNSQKLHDKWANSTLVSMTAEGHEMGGVEFILRVMGLWNRFNATNSHN